MGAVIETRRLRIVPFAEEHLTARYVAWLNDPEVVRFSEQRHVLHSIESCHRYWRSFEGTPSSFWAVVARDPALGHVGNMSVYVDAPNAVADLSILVGDKRVWGQGIGTEAWAAMCDHVFRAAGVRKITAGTIEINHAMRALMRHVGMVEDGRRVGQHLVDGQPVDVVYGALFRDDWRPPPG